MLSAAAYSFRQKSRLAIALSWVAGYTNVVTFVACGGVVVAHTTGNVTHFAEGLAGGQWRPAAYFGFLLTTFVAGSMASALLTELARRRGAASRYVLPVAVEAALLSAMAVGLAAHARVDWQAVVQSGGGGGLWLYGLTGLGTFAMGLQNATITRVSDAVVRTTHLTGVMTDLGLEGVQLLIWYRGRTRARRPGRRGRVMRSAGRHPTAQRVALLASILGSFLFGAFAGAMAYDAAPRVALVAPVAFLLWIIVAAARRPIADVRELDPMADPELLAAGLGRAVLPQELGIYRLHHARANAPDGVSDDVPHDAPDFPHWADRVPRRWRVVVVAVTPVTRLDADAASGLRAAAELLLAQRRRLVIAGLSRAQYKVLADAGVTHVLAPEDLCPDLEFAIARAIDLLGSSADFPRPPA